MRKLIVVLGALSGALLLAQSATPVQAAGSCETTSGTTTCTFSPTGSEDTFEVPDGVSSVQVVATGAPGAVGFTGGSAGRGARVSGDLTVDPGQTLYVNVGGAPTGVAPGADCYPLSLCIGGFNGGGGAGRYGGGGGGASDVREIPRAEAGSLASRLIVAGGGGGSAFGFDSEDCPWVLGGSGGDAGSDGGDGPTCRTVPGGTGGKAGGANAGGAGGSPDGGSGSLGLGGNGGGQDGGGGGGGLFGGGGGGNFNTAFVDPDPVFASGGGGGGGSSLDPDGGPTPTIATGGPSVTISYTGPNTAPTAADDSASTDEDTLLTGNVLANDTDPEDDTLTAIKVTDPANGTLTLSPDGSFTYTPSAGFSGTDSFTYKANDGTNDSNVATVTLTVNPVVSPDQTAPRVSRVEPRDNATGVGPGTNVRAFFSEAMMEGSIDTDTVKMFKAGEDSARKATVTYDAASNKATLDPSADLRRGDRYRVVVTTRATDEAGNRLDQDQDPSNGHQKKVWRFRVRN